MGITAYLESVGVPHNLAADWKWRIPLAQQYLGISDYTGTGTQNTNLVKALQAAGYTYNGGGGSSSSSSNNGGSNNYGVNLVSPNIETYKGYEIRKNITQYTPDTYQIDCNCNAVGYSAPHGFAGNFSDAQRQLNEMVAKAKREIDNRATQNQDQNQNQNQNQNQDQNQNQNQNQNQDQNQQNNSQYPRYITSGGASDKGTETENYNGYVIRKNITQYAPDTYQIDCNCAAAGYNAPHGFASNETDAWNQLNNMVAKAKQMIDQKAGGGTGSDTNQNGGYPKYITSGGAANNGTEIEDYNGYKIRKNITQYAPDSYQIDCNCADVGYSAPHKFAGSEADAWAELNKMVNEAKKKIDEKVGGQSENPENPENPDNTENNNNNNQNQGGNWRGNFDYKWGDAANSEGGDYQSRRNNAAGQSIYNQMKDKIYASAHLARREFLNLLQQLVNASGVPLQITADGQITGVPESQKTGRQNTIKLIEDMVLNLKGVASWEDWINSGSNNNNNNTSTTTTPGATSGSSWFNWINDVSNASTYLFDWLNQRYGNSMNGWADRRAEIGNYATEIQDRMDELKNSFNDATEHLKAASGLQQKAQKIYSDQNIQKMNQQLRQMGFDAGKAAPAVYYQVTKQMADTAVELAKLQSQEETTLAELEAQEAELIDNIKAAGIEADQWSKNMLNELEKQIQTIKDNMYNQRANILGQWTLQPKLDVASNLLQADIENIALYYQNQFLQSNPSLAPVIAANLFGSDWAYCDAKTGVSYDPSKGFGDYLTRCADSIRKNKVSAETQVASAGASKYFTNEGSTGSTGNTGSTSTAPVYILP